MSEEHKASQAKMEAKMEVDMQKNAEESKASQAGIQKHSAEAEKRDKSLNDANKKIRGCAGTIQAEQTNVRSCGKAY